MKTLHRSRRTPAKLAGFAVLLALLAVSCATDVHYTGRPTQATEELGAPLFQHHF